VRARLFLRNHVKEESTMMGYYGWMGAFGGVGMLLGVLVWLAVIVLLVWSVSALFNRREADTRTEGSRF